MRKVLVVDDTKNIRLLLTKCLEIEGFEVITANDGYMALDILKKDDVNLAIIDIKMPQLSGTEVLKKMRSMGIFIPVIIITAYATIKNAVECTQMGAVAYLQKPFTAEKVRSVLKELQIDPKEDNKKIELMQKSLKEIERAINDNNFNDAISMLKNTITVDPTNEMVYLYLSKAYKGIGDIVNADKFYKTYKIFESQ